MFVAKTPSELTYVAKTPYIYIYVLSWSIYFLLGESIIFEHLQRNPRAVSTAGERLGGRLLRDQRLRERLHLHQTGRARRWGEESGQPGTLLLAEGHLANGRIDLGSKKSWGELGIFNSPFHHSFLHFIGWYFWIFIYGSSSVWFVWCRRWEIPMIFHWDAWF